MTYFDTGMRRSFVSLLFRRLRRIVVFRSHFTTLVGGLLVVIVGLEVALRVYRRRASLLAAADIGGAPCILVVFGMVMMRVEIAFMMSVELRPPRLDGAKLRMEFAGSWQARKCSPAH